MLHYDLGGCRGDITRPPRSHATDEASPIHVDLVDMDISPLNSSFGSSSSDSSGGISDSGKHVILIKLGNPDSLKVV
jgi:hypothetical protein